MERPSDAPFFMANPDNAWRRQNFDLLEGRGVNGVNLMEPNPMMALLQVPIIKQITIHRFLEEKVLSYEDVDIKKVDTKTLKGDFEAYVNGAGQKIVDFDRTAVRSTTFEDLIVVAAGNLAISIHDVRSCTPDSENREYAFLAARYWYRIYKIVEEVCYAGRGVSPNIPIRNLTLVFSDENPKLDPVA